jgi:hypothetical protein
VSPVSTRLAAPKQPAANARRRRTTRNAQIVILRSTLPVQLVTLRHEVPQHISGATPKVVAEPAGDSDVAAPVAGGETAAGKGGAARW